MAMTTAVAGTSTPVIQKRFLGSGVQGLRTQHARAVHNTIMHGSISAKFNVDVKEQLDLGTNVLAGALFASLASVESASAAQQVLELAAENDSRGYAILLPLVPAVGWVLFNILQPALNQFNRMKSAKGLAVGFGLGAVATLAVCSSANAAQELAEIAESDARGLAVLGVLIPAVAWVLFNILQPALNQFDKMKASKGLIGAVGLGTAAAAGYNAFFPGEADAMTSAQEVASIAESDNRGLLLLLVVLPAILWVLFNILRPALNQFESMQTPSKAVKGVKTR